MQSLQTSACALIFSVVSAASLYAGELPFGNTPQWESKESYSAGGLTLGDVNRDGALDLVLTVYGNTTADHPTKNVVFLNSSKGFNALPNWRSSDQDYSTESVLADFNRDGFLDMLTVNGGPNAHRTKINFGSATGIESTASWIAEKHMCSISAAVGDVNNDGFLDFFTSNQNYIPKGPGFPALGYISEHAVVDPAHTWRTAYLTDGIGATLGDVDGDGRVQEKLSASGDGKRTLFVLPRTNVEAVLDVRVAGKSLPYFAYVSGADWVSLPVAPPASAEQNVEIRYARTTDPDLALVSNRGPVAIHNNDAGRIDPAATYTAGLDRQGNKLVRFVDIDSDGDLDLFVGGHTAAMLLFENVRGKLSSYPMWASDDASPTQQDVAFGDVNGDGRIDMVTAHFATKLGVYRLYLNSPEGLGTSPQWLVPWAGKTASSIALGDVNADGKLDLVIGRAAGPAAVYLNQR